VFVCAGMFDVYK